MKFFNLYIRTHGSDTLADNSRAEGDVVRSDGDVTVTLTGVSSIDSVDILFG